MNGDEYTRRVTLVCPTCGGDQFSFEDDGESPVTCANCGRQMSRDDLMMANRETIDAQVDDIGAQVTKDAAEQLRKALRDAARGNKNLRFK